MAYHHREVEEPPTDTFVVNFCLAYDTSSCDWRDPDDGPEREICRAPEEFKGVWAAGTMFHYRCTKFETRTFTHPLQYNSVRQSVTGTELAL